jgi:hypothetical protein
MVAVWRISDAKVIVFVLIIIVSFVIALCSTSVGLFSFVRSYFIFSSLCTKEVDIDALILCNWELV